MINTEVSGEKLSKVEQGEAFVGLSEDYLDVMNKLNDDYKAVLKQAIEGMEKIKKSESKIDDAIRINEVRASLKG